MTPQQIGRLRDAWNRAHPDQAIETTPRLSPLAASRLAGSIGVLTPSNSDTGTARVWHDLRDKMGDVCKSEFCWIQQPFVDDKQLRHDLRARFRPPRPHDWDRSPYPDPNDPKNEIDPRWLDSDSIYNCLLQLTQTYPQFKTIYPSPVDFDKIINDPEFGTGCVTNELCNLQLDTDMKRRGKTAFGIVFNLDPHDKDGSHWVALYIDIAGINGRPPGAYYWDSYGIRPPKRIYTLMERVRTQYLERRAGHDAGAQFVLRFNKNRHQHEDCECGMYSLYFITSMLEGRSFDDICSNIVTDETINRLRNVYFARDD